MEVEYRALTTHAAQHLLAVHQERAHTYVAGAEAANHYLLDGDLPPNIVLLAQALHQFEQAARTASEERICLLPGDQPVENLLDIFQPARPVGVEHGDRLGAQALKQVLRHYHVWFARGKNRGDANVAFGGKLRQRRKRRETDTATKHDDILPGRIEFE